ncbi:MAG: hypothetical protein R2764_07695 [Bacteroidales bacterium]
MNHSKTKVRLYMVSLDFPNKHEELLLPFIKENKMKSEVIHLTDTDPNKWINKVSPLWSGSIPATLIYKGNSAEFYETALTYEKLKKLLNQKCNHMKRIAFITAFVIAVNLLYAEGYEPGDVATDFSLKNVDGKMVSLADFPNAKVLL